MAKTPQPQKPATPQPSAKFDPFRDRLSRDIRNDLSRSFGQSLADGRLSAVEERCAHLLKGNLDRCYRAYVESRIEQYRRGFDRIRKCGRDPLLQGLVLWDLRLFFEMHEILEHAWRRSAGDRKKLLQSLIRAAGVYIKLEHGYHRQAARMAEKACAVLERNTGVLRGYFAPEELIASLRSLNPVPPVLLGEPPSWKICGEHQNPPEPCGRMK